MPALDECLLIAGALLVVGCQIWLVLRIMRDSPGLALVALFVPLFKAFYAVHNWDVARRPVFGWAAGVVLFVVGLTLSYGRR